MKRRAAIVTRWAATVGLASLLGLQCTPNSTRARCFLPEGCHREHAQ